MAHLSYNELLTDINMKPNKNAIDVNGGTFSGKIYKDAHLEMSAFLKEATDGALGTRLVKPSWSCIIYGYVIMKRNKTIWQEIKNTSTVK